MIFRNSALLILIFAACCSKTHAETDASDYSMELIVIPPGNELSYDDPRELLLTLAGAPKELFLLPFNNQQEILKDYFKDHWPFLDILLPKMPDVQKVPDTSGNHFQVGHTMVRLRAPNEDHFFGATDFGVEAERDLIFNQKIGFAFVWQGVPGRLHDQFVADYNLNFALGLKRRPAITRFEISETTYLRLVRFLQEMNEAVQSMNFSLGGRPRYREGFGCSSVGEAFVEVGGLLRKWDLDRWKRTIRVPNEIIGSVEENRRIEVADVVNRKIGKRWAKADEPHRVLEFIEVEKIYRWMRRMYLEEREFLAPYWDNDDRYTHEKRKEGFAYALHIDARHIETPDEPLFFVPAN